MPKLKLKETIKKSRLVRKIFDFSASEAVNFEMNGMPSMTVPNDSMSVRATIKRFNNGQSLPSAPDLLYTSDLGVDLSHVASMDRFELIDARRQADLRMEAHKKSHEEFSRKLQELDDKARFDEAVAAKAAELSSKKDAQPSD